MELFWALAIVAVVALAAYYLLSQRKGSGTTLVEKEETPDEIMESPVQQPAPPAPAPEPEPVMPARPTEPTGPVESTLEQGMDIDIDIEDN